MTNVSAPLGERTRIDVRAIERELTALWHVAAEEQQESGFQGVTRTCVLNLLVATPGGQVLEQATDTIARLTSRHPNRAIVINAQPSVSDAPLEAWVQAHCQIPGPGRPQVCGEQITIEARGAAVSQVPGTVLPLLVPDLPVIFWWPYGMPYDQPLFKRLSDLADRIIVDSATCETPERALVRLAELLGKPSEISDMVWARLTPWREMIAQFFDSPSMLPHLYSLQRIEVTYRNPTGDRSAALLLLGWLGSRLGWTLNGTLQRDGAVTTFALARPDGVRVQVRLQHAPHATTMLEQVTLEAEHSRFTIECADDDQAITTVEVEGNMPLRRMVRVAQLSDADLLAEELRLLGRDYGFVGALQLTTSFLA
jgi:glucose-6-phosphate dehydrogenase assembly protein OpcA